MIQTAILFYLLATVTGICAIGVVVTQNIVRAAAWLLFALAGTAGVFFLLDAQFVGATQLLVYVGGTLVLVVFGVMLTAQGPFIHMKIGAVEWLIALATGLVLFTVLVISLLAVKAENPKGQALSRTSGSTVIGQSLLGLTGASPKGNVTGIPARAGVQRPRTPMAYLLVFEIISVHLLVVLIGAAYLARAKRRAAAQRSQLGAMA
jgi:NADH:ubiquinone oxidoreductase subunit 6 (subunit J)